MTSDKTLELEEGFEDVLGSRAVLKKVRLSLSLSYTFKIHEKKYQILRKGSGERPRVGQLATLKMQGRVLSSTKPFLPMKTVCKRVGEKNFVSGIDLVLRLMFPGEKSIVRLTSRHGYGKDGCEELSVPADVNLEYEIELVSLGSLRVPPQQMSQQDLLSDCEDYQNKAKKQFSLKNYGESERLYVKALEFANALSEEPSIKIRCLNNIATVEFMLKKMKESKAACDSVLLLDSENAKALFRMGMILETETEYVKSLQYFQRAMKRTDDNDEALRRRTIKAMKRVKKSREKYIAAKKKFSESMLRRRRNGDSKKESKDDSTGDIQKTTISKRAKSTAPITTPIIIGSLIAALIIFGMYYV